MADNNPTEPVPDEPATPESGTRPPWIQTTKIRSRPDPDRLARPAEK